jgi:hypothetical protein
VRLTRHAGAVKASAPRRQIPVRRDNVPITSSCCQALKGRDVRREVELRIRIEEFAMLP